MSEMPGKIWESGQIGEDRDERGQDRAGSQGLDRVEGRVRQNQPSTSARAAAVLRKASRLFSAVPPSTHPSSGSLLRIISDWKIRPSLIVSLF